jgi:putative transposase
LGTGSAGGFLRVDGVACFRHEETEETWGQTGRFPVFLIPCLSFMARLARVIAVDVPHHVTQRGNARRYILDTDSDRLVYLDLLRHACQLYKLSLLGYCLMSNHVHLVVTPRRRDSLALALKDTHGRYATYWNVRHTSSGHAWQGRFYSCPLDLSHLWAALRYTELNPVRARIVSTPEAYRWSSAGAHCGTGQADIALEMDSWNKHWDAKAWREYLSGEGAEDEAKAIRQCTHTGRPLGSPEFIESLEKAMSRRLSPQKGGRPSKSKKDKDQASLSFD